MPAGQINDAEPAHADLRNGAARRVLIDALVIRAAMDDELAHRVRDSSVRQHAAIYRNDSSDSTHGYFLYCSVLPVTAMRMSRG